MDDALNFDGRAFSPRFALHVVDIPPAGRRAYDASEWVDAMVLVEGGAVELECTRGGRRRFGAGSMLPLAILPLVALHNPGLEPVRLTAISRSALATDEFLPPSSSEHHDLPRDPHH